MKTAAPNLLVAVTALVALSAGMVLTAGDPAVFETRQASFLVFDDGMSGADANAMPRVEGDRPEPVKVVAPSPMKVNAGVRS